MADIQKTIEILFVGTDAVSDTISAVTADLGQLNGAVADATAPFASIAEGALKAEAAILALGGAFLTLSVNQAGKFSDAFAEVSTLFDATDEQLQGFSEDILGYSRDSVFAFEEITNAGYQAISFGTDYTQSLDVVATAEKLAIGGKADLAAAVELLSGTLNAYGLDADEAAHLSDIFFTVVKDGKTTIPELANSLSKVTGVAASAGIGMETLGAALAAVTATGAPTSEAVTGLKALISNIIKPTKEAALVANELGIGFSATALETQGLDGLLKTLFDTTGGNIETMGKLFGSTEALNVALILGADSSGKFAGALADMDNAAGATEAAFQKMADNISFTNQKVVNNARATLVEIGLPLLDGYREIADGIINLFKGVSVGIDSGSFDPIFNELNRVSTEFAAFINDIADDIPAALAGIDLGGFITAFDSLAQSVIGVFDGVDLTSAEGLQNAIQSVIDSIEGLTNFTAGLVQGAEPVITKLVEWAQGFNDLDAESQQAAGELTGFLAIINKLTAPIDALIGGLGGIGTGLQLIGGAQIYKVFQGSTGLITLLQNAKTAALAFGGAFAAPLAVATAAIGLTTVAVAGAVDEYNQWQAAEDELAASLQRGNIARAELEGSYQVISSQTGVLIQSSADLRKEIEAGTIVLDKQSGVWMSAADAQRDFVEEVINAGEASLDWSASNRELVDEFGNLYGTVDKATSVIDENKQAAIDAAAAYYELAGNAPDVALAMATIEQGTISATDALSKVDDETEAVRLKLLDLASDERIAAMEFTASIQTAQIDADAKTISAAFDSITATVEATTGNIGSLFDTLSGTTDFSDKWNLEAQIEKENDLRDEAFGMQQRLIEAQITYQELKNQQLKKGGGDINITMDGIYPELEMIMWEIVKRVRVQVTENETDFLNVAPPI